MARIDAQSGIRIDQLPSTRIDYQEVVAVLITKAQTAFTTAVTKSNTTLTAVTATRSLPTQITA